MNFNKSASLTRDFLSGEECKKAYVNSLEPVDNRFDILCQQADDILKKQGNKIMFPLDLKRLLSIPWKLYIFSQGELLHPHSHGDAIFIPLTLTKRLTVDTLIHEKIHLFQKLYPIETQKYLKGAHIVGKCDLLNSPHRNPDVDVYIYNTTININNDNDNDFMENHPFEIMASEMTHVVIMEKE
jgi:hypothetical protein